MRISQYSRCSLRDTWYPRRWSQQLCQNGLAGQGKALPPHASQVVSGQLQANALLKNVAEYLRARHVDMPQKFLEKEAVL